LLKTIVKVSSLLVIGVGLLLAALGYMGWNPFMGQMGGASTEERAGGFGDLVPNLAETGGDSAGGPEDKTLKLTIPKMKRIENDAIPDAAGDDEAKLKGYAGIHLKGTGFPWQEGANVYIAGHRLGYPGTDSFLAFYDQDKLKKDDEIYVTDSEGRKYTYRVFKSFVVDPTDVWVTKPVPGKSVLTLQTCTLPDYSKRIITRAELVDVA
jgi:sortase A